jgi:hypothetical protein
MKRLGRRPRPPFTIPPHMVPKHGRSVRLAARENQKANRRPARDITRARPVEAVNQTRQSQGSANAID